MDWSFLAILGGGAAVLAWRRRAARKDQEDRGASRGLRAAPDLTHLPSGLGASALWRLSDGGFESRVLRGTISDAAADTEVTAFDLETLRERRGEWAFLPVERPFRIRGAVTVAVCEVPGPLPHVLCKREGRGDELLAEDWIERGASVAKLARGALGLPHHHAAELPPGLSLQPREVPGAAGWRAYAGDDVLLRELLGGGLGAALGKIQLRDLVIEVVDRVLVAYPATRDALSIDGFVELCEAAAGAAVAVRHALGGASPRGG
ncbi:MAG: hypothetical protein R3B48_10475 [Kofleriaceae bacterium]